MWLAVSRGEVLRGMAIPVLAVLTAVALHGTWAIDDAGITWSYARNMATGHGPVAYIGGPMGEGFSDPLWVLLLGGAESLGLRADLSAKTVGMVCGVIGVLLTALLVRSDEEVDGLLAAAALATSASWALWAASGLETAFLGVLLVASTLLARVHHPFLAAVFAGFAAITRPEGPLLAMAALIAGRAPWPTLAAPLLAAGAWLGVRVTTFGLWWPLPAYVKLSGDAMELVRGGRYLIGALAPVGAVLGLGAFAQPPQRRREWVVDLAPLWAAILFCLVVGGDWMRHGRFLAPVLPYVVAATVPRIYAWLGRDGRGMLLTALALAPQAVEGISARTAPPLPMAVQARQGEALVRAARSACGDSFPLVATPDVGGVLWEFPNVRVADLGGLTEPELVGRDPAVYWPERLATRPVHTAYLHGDWPARTGLDDEAMRHAGYVRICRRGAEPTAPTLWVHRRCDLGLAGIDREVVEEWCVHGAR